MKMVWFNKKVSNSKVQKSYQNSSISNSKFQIVLGKLIEVGILDNLQVASSVPTLCCYNPL